MWSVYSVNKFPWLINKPYVGECGRCLWKRKSCVTAAPRSPGWELSKTRWGPVLVPWIYWHDDVPRPHYSVLFSVVKCVLGIWRFSWASKLPTCATQHVPWLVCSHLMCLWEQAAADSSLSLPVTSPKALFQTQAESWRNCYCGVLLSASSQDLVVSSWCVFWCWYTKLRRPEMAAPWESGGLTAVGRPCSAQAPTWEAWADVWNVWAVLTSPKGLLKIGMGNVEDEFTLSSTCTSFSSGDAWKVASSKAVGGCDSWAGRVQVLLLWECAYRRLEILHEQKKVDNLGRFS